MRRIHLPRAFSLALALMTWGLAAARGQSSAPPDLSADTFIADQAQDAMTARGSARLRDGPVLLTADEIHWARATDIVHASGHVVLTRGEERVLADDLVYHRRTGYFSAVAVRAGRYPFYVEGATAQGTLDKLVIRDATVVYREPGPWQPTIRAREVDYSPNHFLQVHDSSIGVGAWTPIPLSRFGQDLAGPAAISYVTLNGGYRGSLGAYLDAGWHLPVATGVSVGPEVGLYSARGIMIGPLANYDLKGASATLLGDIRSGFIDDQGNRGLDVLGNPVPVGRAFVSATNTGTLGEDTTLNSSLAWWTDSEVYRDFRPNHFYNVQEPDNFLEVDHTDESMIASFFTRFQPDAYFPVQQRLPEIRLDLLPSGLPGGLYERADAGIAVLREDPPGRTDPGHDLASDRFDAFYGLSRPVAPTDWLSVTPVAGARFTEYWDTSGADSSGGVGRALGEVGVDAQMRASGTFDYQNDYLGIDGLRHLFTPILSYRYIPQADKDTAYIPPIDRSTFSPELPILELGDMRAIDQMQAVNVLRVGINNTLQTRDPAYGSRDLVTLNLDNDLRFERAPGQTDTSDLHAALDFMPAKWVDFGVSGSVSSTTFAPREINTNVEIHDADLWSVGVGTSFLSDSFGYFDVPGLGPQPVVGLNAYHLETRARLNEIYEAFARVDYDGRSSVFTDQAYGVYQKIANTWVVQYTVTLYSGNARASRFGFNVGIELLRF